MPELAAIPLIDARDGGTLHHARVGEARAQALRDACLKWFPAVVRLLLPNIDGVARRWLERSQSPYVDEVRAIAATLRFPGIWFLNGSYQWSCTALAREDADGPWLLRTLDWPFPGLGRYVDVVHMHGPAGDYFNVSWAGYVGALTACAPGRFAAVVNQAPMRRRSQARLLRLYDLTANAAVTLRHVRHIPPDQLLRRVFETCRDYEDARRALEATPVARPVIYTLVGCRPGERCVIERTETDARVRETATAAANDWLEPSPQWEGRIAANKVLVTSFAEAAENSRARFAALSSWQGDVASGDFSWVKPPVLNPYTRLAAAMCPARGVVRVIGYEPQGGDEPAVPATQPREVAARPLAA